MRRQRTSRDPIGDKVVRGFTQSQLVATMQGLARARFERNLPGVRRTNDIVHGHQLTDADLIDALLDAVEDAEADCRSKSLLAGFNERISADLRELVVDTGLWSLFYDSDEPTGTRCPVCWRLLDQPMRGRPRVYCGKRECKNKARSRRNRQQQAAVRALRANAARQTLVAALREKLSAAGPPDSDHNTSSEAGDTFT